MGKVGVSVMPLENRRETLIGPLYRPALVRRGFGPAVHAERLSPDAGPGRRRGWLRSAP